MKFIEHETGRWTAHDKADVYEIIRGADKVKGTIFVSFKNRVIPVGVDSSFEAAVKSSEAEQICQNWFSNNPENAEKNNVARQKRRAEDKSDDSVPPSTRILKGRLYRGRKNKSGD